MATKRKSQELAVDDDSKLYARPADLDESDLRLFDGYNPPVDSPPPPSHKAASRVLGAAERLSLLSLDIPRCAPVMNEDNDGVEDENEDDEVLPFWYQSVWASVAVAIAVLLICDWVVLV